MKGSLLSRLQLLLHSGALILTEQCGMEGPAKSLKEVCPPRFSLKFCPYAQSSQAEGTYDYVRKLHPRWIKLSAVRERARKHSWAECSP